MFENHFLILVIKQAFEPGRPGNYRRLLLGARSMWLFPYVIADWKFRVKVNRHKFINNYEI